MSAFTLPKSSLVASNLPLWERCTALMSVPSIDPDQVPITGQPEKYHDV
jgi:hypothetical protein